MMEIEGEQGSLSGVPGRKLGILNFPTEHRSSHSCPVDKQI